MPADEPVVVHRKNSSAQSGKGYREMAARSLVAV
jgi:hypothetical protein